MSADRAVPAVPRRLRTLLIGAVTATVGLALLTYLLLLAPITDDSSAVISDIALVPIAAAAAVCCGWRARRSQGRVRRAWTLMAASGTLWALAELSWFINYYGLDNDQSPSFADVFYLAALPPAAMALIIFPPPRRPGSERVRTLLGALVVGGSVLFVSRALALSVIFPAATGTLVGRAVYVAYPIADVVLGSLALIMLVRVGARPRLHLYLLAMGFVFYSLADIAYSNEAALDAYRSGSFLDLGWAAGYALFGLAALAPRASDAEAVRPKGGQISAQAEERYTAVTSLVVYVPLLSAVVVACARPSPVTDPVLIVTGVGILLLFGARQALLASDNTRLRHDLQAQVDQLETRSSELRRLALQNERIVQSVVDGVFGVDARGQITFVNARASEMLGRDPGDLLQSSEEHVFHEPACPVRAAELAALLVADAAAGAEERLLMVADRLVPTALRTGTVVTNAAAEFVRGDGVIFPVELAVGPIVESGAITGAVVVFRDVSARRAVEKMKNEFVSVVSHELRTPLTSIRGALGLIAGGMGGDLNPHGRRMMSIALESSERLTRLIEDMLDLERMESGALTMTMRVCEAEHLVATAVEDVRALAAEREVTIVRDGVGGTVRADPDRVIQTLTNLLGNAIKFSLVGGTIAVSARPGESMVEFSVEDHGRGVPADRLDRIFERFEQVDSSDSRELGGTGLGLTISRDIVRLHGGRIWAVSELGHGSTFLFTLPLAIETDTDRAEALVGSEPKEH